MARRYAVSVTAKRVHAVWVTHPEDGSYMEVSVTLREQDVLALVDYCLQCGLPVEAVRSLCNTAQQRARRLEGVS